MGLEKFRLTERRLMVLIMSALLVFFTLTLIVANFRQQAAPIVTGPRQIVRVMPERPRRFDYHYVYAEIFDPSLMALPNAMGFSRQLWWHTTNGTLATYAPAVELAYLPDSVPAEIPELLDLPAIAEEMRAVVTKLPAQMQEPTEVLINLPATEKSVVEVTGGLGSRRLLATPDLPVVTNATPLRSTRLRIAVASDGAVRYAMLERSCGNSDVDEHALEVVKRLRFEFERAGDSTALVWGAVRFAWATVAGK